MLFGKKILVFVFLALIIPLGSFFIFKDKIFAEDGSGQIYISEVRVSGEDADDEFIRLYNPTNSPVSLKDWSLKKKKDLNEETILTDIGTEREPVTGEKIADKVLEIPPKGYFLIAPRFHCGNDKQQKCYLGIETPNNYYSVKSAYLTDNNTIILFNSQGQQADVLSWGEIPKGETLKINKEDSNDNSENAGADAENDDTAGNNNNNDAGTDADADFDNSSDINENSGSGVSDDSDVQQEDDTNSSQNDNGQNADSSQQSSQSGSSSASSVTGYYVAEKIIIINELLINSPGDDSQAEFIELYNAGKDEVDLSGWSVEDQIGKTGRYVFSSGEKIGSGKYKVFYSGTTKLSLNNTGDGATLKDNSGNVIYKTPASASAKEGVSFALNENQQWVWTEVSTPGSKNIIKNTQQNKTKDSNKDSSADKSEKDEGSENKNEESQTDEQYDFSDGVTINEIFSNPPGRDNQNGNFEWIELYNNNDQSVNLKGWFLDDVLDKGSKPYRFLKDEIIQPKSYLVISSGESKIAFNNSQEEVNLLWPDKTVEDSVFYEKSEEGFSYSLSSDEGWFWSKKITPGAENIIALADSEKTGDGTKAAVVDSSHQNSADFTETENEDASAGEKTGEVLDISSISFNNQNYQYVSIKEAKKLPLKSLIGLDGLVSVPTGIFGKNVFYLIDKNSEEGLQMFSYKGNLPILNLGDRVQVFGFLSEVGGEKRLVLDDNFKVEKMGTDGILTSAALNYSNIEDMSGNLIRTEGTVENKSGNVFTLSMSDGKLKVYAKPETGISFGNLKNGDRISVIGHLSHTSAGYRILPRFSTDVNFLESRAGGIIEEERKGLVAGYIYGWRLDLLFVLIMLSAAGWVIIKRRKRSALF